MDDGGDAADELGAHVRQEGHGSDHEGVQTHVADHVFFVLLCLKLAALEARKLGVFRNQNELEKH